MPILRYVQKVVWSSFLKPLPERERFLPVKVKVAPLAKVNPIANIVPKKH